MRARTLIATLAGSAALACAIPAGAAAQYPAGVVSHMTCLAPGDAAGIDAVLARAASPLAGEGSAFVEAAADAGIDPRALVAIAAHETMLETYGPSQAIRNPFGLGPGMAFATERAAIEFAARALARYYLTEGRTALAEIGAKWAPVGVANDPGGLNRHWTTGVGTYYAALGGDPSRPILASAQDAAPSCVGAPAPAGAGDPVAGPPVVTAWDGRAPRVAGRAARDGADPATAEAAVLEGFVFPLALPVGGPASYRDAFSDAGATECDGGRLQCAVTIGSAPGQAAVAAVEGTLRAASPAEREAGLAFWIETARGDRLGYGPLAAYQPGVGEGAEVTAGQHLGATAGWMRIAWERAGARINPFPLLRATRPPSGG